MKIVLFIASYDIEKDFESNFGKHLSYEKGMTPEELSRKMGISVLIAKCKLKVIFSLKKYVLLNFLKKILNEKYLKNIFFKN